jgi:hypothetical protein
VTFYIVCFIALVAFTAVNVYRWKRPGTLSAKRVEYCRTGALYGSGGAIILLLKILTHSYR